MVLIYTRRGLGVWMRVDGYLWVGIDEARIQNVTSTRQIYSFVIYKIRENDINNIKSYLSKITVLRKCA